MWFTATGLSHAFWMCLAPLVGTEVPERLVQMFSTETEIIIILSPPAQHRRQEN